MENKKLTTSLVASLLIATNLFSQELSTITVTSATKSEQSIKDVTSNVEVITKEEIEDRHFTTVIEALNSLPGISFNSNGGLGSSSSLYLRGMGNSRTLVLIDGVRYQDPSSTSGANLSHVMINDIERIEVIKGSQSGIWGAEAAAGVVNIITKKAQSGTNGTISLEAGSFNTKKYGTSIAHDTENFDLKFSANKIETDGFTNQLPYGSDEKNFEKDGYKNTTLTLNANYYINNDSKLSFDVKDINGLSEYDGGSWPATVEEKANNDTFKSDIDTTLYAVGYSQKIKNHNLNLKYELSKFKRHEIGTTSGVLKFFGETHNIELNDEYKYLNNDFLIFGIGLNKDDVDYIKVDNTRNEKDSKGKYFYLTNSNKLNNIVFTQSLRYDKYNNFDNKLTGKVGIKYKVNDDLSFNTNMGTAYNVPSIIKQLNPWGTSNLDINPEESKSFDIGLEYRNFSLTYFNQKITDLIDWDNSDKKYKNLDGKSTFKGIELSYKKEIFSDTLLSFNYTRLSAKDEDGEYLSKRAKQNLKASLDYYGVKDFHININAEYVGNRQQDVYGVGIVETGNYTVWNSVINYEINKDLSTYLKIDNVFDKYYQTSYEYATAPRSAYIGLKYKF